MQLLHLLPPFHCINALFLPFSAQNGFLAEGLGASCLRTSPRRVIHTRPILPFSSGVIITPCITHGRTPTFGQWKKLESHVELARMRRGKMTLGEDDPQTAYAHFHNSWSILTIARPRDHHEATEYGNRKARG
ncbi:hypothetical protein B0T25DRAFT_54065 [Lasiosphaeria hispida]|uniref:Uncharacterized protein n=1 Tax=Lasiosphaeria hispida TaxID=260671 RepID=A0AAJ0HWF1_9PEZI|nr:hypothetical protein B0T25DRAFT_54065 [Lasiosphaeria hispida]